MIGRDLLDLAGRVAIVTGATRGIGLATARLLAEYGAAVVISSRKPERCDAVAAELTAAGHRAIAVAAHVGRQEDCRRLVEEAQARLGRLDVMVANAGTNPVFEDVSKLTEASWHKLMETNLTGSWRLACHALPALARESGSAMILVSSINARFGVPGSGAYGVSKAGIEQLVRQLAVEWGGRGVRVNAVAPGTTRTDMIRALTADPEFLELVRARTPLGRIGAPEDVASVILFLASDAARHVTGQVLTVDGGETILRARD